MIIVKIRKIIVLFFTIIIIIVIKNMEIVKRGNERGPGLWVCCGR